LPALISDCEDAFTYASGELPDIEIGKSEAWANEWVKDPAARRNPSTAPARKSIMRLYI
jgi:hypothetical protein